MYACSFPSGSMKVVFAISSRISAASSSRMRGTLAFWTAAQYFSTVARSASSLASIASSSAVEPSAPFSAIAAVGCPRRIVVREQQLLHSAVPCEAQGLLERRVSPPDPLGILLLCIHRIVDEKVRIAHEVYDAGFEPGIDVVHVSVELVVRDEADHMAVDPYAIPDHEGRVADAHYVQREVAQLVASLVEMLELHGRGDDAEWDGEIDRAHLSGEQILDVDVLSALGR